MEIYKVLPKDLTAIVLSYNLGFHDTEDLEELGKVSPLTLITALKYLPSSPENKCDGKYSVEDVYILNRVGIVDGTCVRKFYIYVMLGSLSLVKKYFIKEFGVILLISKIRKHVQIEKYIRERWKNIKIPQEVIFCFEGVTYNFRKSDIFVAN